MAERKLKIAFIGCGGMAGAHLRAYHRILETDPARMELAAVCDPVRELAQKFADQTAPIQGSAPRVYIDTTEMLRAERLDGADICCPHSHHHINAIACLDAGVNVMVEKPFGITVKASRAILAAAERNGKIAATAENVRRGISQRTAHWLIHDRGLIGRPRLFFAQHAGWQEPKAERRWHWRTETLLGGGGMVMDSGAHYCDTLRYLFGDLESAFARVTRLEERPHRKDDRMVPDEREDTWVATLQFESGLTGVWSWTTAAPGHEFTKVVYYGSEGCLLDHGDVFHGPFSSAEVIGKDGVARPMTALQDEFLASLSDAERNHLFPHGWTDGVVLECYDFLGAIAEKRSPEVDGTTGLRAKAIAETIYESSAAGQLVRYADVLDGKIDAYQRPINEHWGL
jgi:UDP-N-acetyl-2-amino-2-deoxyglucuronate dehydrogenase